MDSWAENLRGLRHREMAVVRRLIGNRRFERCLELGAGAGLQSIMLKEFCDVVIATDLNEQRLMQAPEKYGIQRRVIDAEALADQLAGETFDLIFSSNMLEHLPCPDDCLKGCLAVLSADGVIVHVVPNPTWRTLCTILHPVAKVRNLVHRISTNAKSASRGGDSVLKGSTSRGNNLKLDRGNVSGALAMFSRFLPPVHGVGNGLIDETLRFRRKSWQDLFQRNELEVIGTAKGPISTGHGFGFKSLKTLLEKVGVSSEYVFLLRRKNAD